MEIKDIMSPSGLATDYRRLLKKYIANVAAAEGRAFAFDTSMAPCRMKDEEFSEEDKAALAIIFTEIK